MKILQQVVMCCLALLFEWRADIQVFAAGTSLSAWHGGR